MSYKLSYGRTYNLGNYESERIDIEYTYEDEDPLEAIAFMKKLVEHMHRQPMDPILEPDDMPEDTSEIEAPF